MQSEYLVDSSVRAILLAGLAGCPFVADINRLVRRDRSDGDVDRRGRGRVRDGGGGGGRRAWDVAVRPRNLESLGSGGCVRTVACVGTGHSHLFDVLALSDEYPSRVVGGIVDIVSPAYQIMM
jgi:hypothetical protein